MLLDCYFNQALRYFSSADIDNTQWWWVDMGNTYCIGKVVIFNRVDCCKERLAGAVVRIGIDSNKTNNAICGTTSSMIEESAKLEVICAIQGRYISIHLTARDTHTQPLTLCEVEAVACGGTGKTLKGEVY